MTVPVWQGKLKTIYENTPKNAVDPTQKFDCHVFKNASKVASLYSYRAFEHTQVCKGTLEADPPTRPS